MEQDTRHLLGTYNDIWVKEGDDTISLDIIRIIGDEAYSRQGKIVKISELGTRYEKIVPEWMDPKIAGDVMASMPSDIRAQAEKRKAEIAKGLEPSKPEPTSAKDIVGSNIRLFRPEETSIEPQPERSVSLPWFHNAPQPTTELESLIVSSMKLGYEKKETSELPVTISLKFDFDIEKIVAGASMMTGATDKEILEAFFKYYPIDVDAVRQAVINELMSPAEPSAE